MLTEEQEKILRQLNRRVGVIMWLYLIPIIVSILGVIGAVTALLRAPTAF